MGCSAKLDPSMNWKGEGCSRRRIILEETLIELGFSKVQIDWVVEFIKSKNLYHSEISEVGWFPPDSKYGFTEDERVSEFGNGILGSKYNVRIVFNYWEQGTKKEFRVLLVKINKTIIN